MKLLSNRKKIGEHLLLYSWGAPYLGRIYHENKGREIRVNDKICPLLEFPITTSSEDTEHDGKVVGGIATSSMCQSLNKITSHPTSLLSLSLSFSRFVILLATATILISEIFRFGP